MMSSRAPPASSSPATTNSNSNINNNNEVVGNGGATLAQLAAASSNSGAENDGSSLPKVAPPFAAKSHSGSGNGGGGGGRPASEIFFANAQHPLPEAKHIDRWFESLSQFEDMLEDMAKVSLDPVFKDELNAIDQWFSVLSEPERTAALYSLMQHCTDNQVRFFITILQQMLKMDQQQQQHQPNGGGGGASLAAKGEDQRHSVPVHPTGVGGSSAILTSSAGGHNSLRSARPQQQPTRMSYDSSNSLGPSGLGSGVPAVSSMLANPTSITAGIGGRGSIYSNSHNNMSAENMLQQQYSLTGGIDGSGVRRPKSSSHEADINPDWRLHRGSGGGMPSSALASGHNSAVVSPTTNEHFPHHYHLNNTGGGSRRQSNNLMNQQTPRASVDMEPQDFRWSSLTENLEPFGNMGQDTSSSALSNILDTNMNRISGIAARRSVGNRLSIAVKSPRETMQSQQQQHLAATMAQMTMGAGSHGNGGLSAQSSPIGTSFGQQIQQQSVYQSAARSGGGGSMAVGTGHPYSQQRIHATGPIGSGGPTTPVRNTFARQQQQLQQPSAPAPASSAASSSVPAAPGSVNGSSVDLELVKNIPAWLRSLRLHKYTDCFAGMDWMDVVNLNDEQLQAKGVAALGARRKMLKVFESVLSEL